MPARATRAPARRPAKRAPRSNRRHPASRYLVVYDIEGPRVRLGLLWFFVAFVAMALGPLPTALVYGGAAAVGAAQTDRAWRRRRARPDPLVAPAGAGALVLGAVLGAGGTGLAALGLAGAACWLAMNDRGSSHHVLADAGATVRCALFIGIAGASVVLTLRYDVGAALALLLLVSSYEAGDYLIGTGARNPFEGPVAGGASVLVMTFVIAAIGIGPFEFGPTWSFGLLAVVLCPLGQLAASAILPAPDAPASALRRLDSLLVLAPVWAWAVGLYLDNIGR